MRFKTIEEMVVASADSVRPPERITVSEAASRFHMTGGNGVAVRPFDLDKTPYLREPMDVLESRDHTGMAFAGPARAGKSVMYINWMIYKAICDPSNMMLVHMSRDTGREWSQQDLERAIANSPELNKRLMPGRINDNVFDKRFMSGMRVSITWPTIKNLSGKTVGSLWIMDMDRIKPQLIDGEAHVFDATRARARTLRNRGMCAAEASPGFDITDPKWQPTAGSHEAPPTEGILSIYNRGDRRRWFWSCPHCDGKFEPKFNLLRWNQGVDIPEAAASVWMECPHCFPTHGAVITPTMLPELNANGRWIKEGEQWLQSGEVVGEGRRSKIASFWMFGPAAGTVGPENWEHLVTEYLTATEAFEKTGDEGPLRSTVNLNNGEPYLPKAMENGRLPEELKNRAFDWGGTREAPVVPEGVRFLITTVDVQAGSKPAFVVHVYGIGEGGDIWHVDMFKIRYSPNREVDGMEGQKALIDPAAYPEDWDALIEQVIERSYPLADSSGRHMRTKIVGCDSGGAAATGADAVSGSVTDSAYQFYMKLRATGDHKRFHLLKGAPSKTDPLPLRPTMWNTTAKGNFALPSGGIQGWLVNSNSVKDTVSNKLGRLDPGGQIYFPAWAEDWLYAQLTAEVRTDKGWERTNKKKKNEAFDLLAYCIALGHHPDIRLNYIDWSNPPGWAKPWDQNDMVFGGDAPVVAEPVKQRKSLKELSQELGGG